jgi:DNA polymerase III delta subunit
MSFFQEMLFQKISSGTFSKFRGYIPLSKTIREKIPNFAQQYSRQEIENALLLLGKIDERIKTTKVSDESELIQFIFNVISK